MILFDGYWGYMEVPQYLSDAEQMEFARKNYVRAATDNTTTWIVDCSCNAELEECFSKDIFKKRVKVLSNYVETLVKTVTDILSGIVNKL